MRYFLLLLFISSCGTEDPVDQDFDPQLIEIVREFETDLVACGVKMVNSNLRKITYVEEFVIDADAKHEHEATSKNTIGMALNYEADVTTGGIKTGTYRWQEIQIKNTAKSYCPISRKVLVYHELGHASMGFGHDPDPRHIMSAFFNALACEYWEDNWDFELNRFFGRECK